MEGKCSEGEETDFLGSSSGRKDRDDVVTGLLDSINL
jgi:hypothetical protein